MRIPLGAIIFSSLIFLGACSSDGLMKLTTTSSGPDEFLIMPVKPLTEPANYSDLPTPTPGADNLTDQHPRSDAIVALGGRDTSTDAQGVSASDAALVNHTNRYGVASNTRAELAKSDAKYRKRKSALSWLKLGKVDRYSEVYKKQTLNPFDETKRFRRVGIPTPSSPPANK